MLFFVRCFFVLLGRSSLYELSVVKVLSAVIAPPYTASTALYDLKGITAQRTALHADIKV